MKNRIFYFNMLRKTYLFSVKQTKKILGYNDSPHCIALGVGIGVFIAFTPTIPFQMTISFFLAWIFRANKPAAMVQAWLTNPITAPPIFFAEYITGAYLFNYPIIDTERLWSYWDKIKEFELLKPGLLWDQLKEICPMMWNDIGIPLLIGSLIWSTILGILSYWAFYKLIKKRRLAKKNKILLMKSASTS